MEEKEVTNVIKALLVEAAEVDDSSDKLQQVENEWANVLVLTYSSGERFRIVVNKSKL